MNNLPCNGSELIYESSHPLSNHYIQSLQYEGCCFNSAFHLYCYLKAKINCNESVANIILSAAANMNEYAIWKLMKTVTPSSEDDVMVDVIHLKLQEVKVKKK